MDILTLIVAGAAAAGWFSASSALVDQIPHASLMAAALLVGAVVVFAYAGLPWPSRIRRMGTWPALRAALAGAAVFAVAPLVVLACRLTDAPSGSEVLFFTTAAWGALAVAGAALSTRRPSLTQGAGALMGLLGVATIVANWERPSSFSPFVKFPLLEIGMLAAGAIFAAGSVVLRSTIKQQGVRTALSVAWGGALVSAIAWALVSLALSREGFAGSLAATITASRILSPQLLLAAGSAGVFAAAWTASLDRLGLAKSASALYLPAVLLTGLAASEGVLRPALGINPVQWGGAIAGIVLVAVSLVALLAFAPPRTAVPRERQTLWQQLRQAGPASAVATVVAAAAVALGATALFLPAFHVTVVGQFAGRTFSASWDMIGAEAAAAWLPLAAALLALALALDSIRYGLSPGARIGGVALVVASAAVWPLLGQTPLRTWNRWLPSEVLQDLGTEYARMDFVRIAHPVAIVALALALIAAVASVAGVTAWAIAGRRQPERSA